MFEYARHVRNRNVTHPLPRQPDARAQVIGAYIAWLYLSTLAIAFAGGRARAGCAHARRYSQRSHPRARARLIAAFYCPPLIRLAQLLPLAGVAATAELQSSGRRARAPARQTLPKALSVDDAALMMDNARGDTPQALRDRALVELLYSSGLRLSELIGLDLEYFDEPNYRSAGWLDWSAAQVIVTGKGNRRRMVPVGRKAMAALQAWRAVRSQFIR